MATQLHSNTPPPTSIGLLSVRSPARDRLRTGRLLIELGIYWVLFEAVIRRALPHLNSPILAVKFAYYPLLYLVLWPRLKRFVAFRYWPAGMAFYLCWGIMITLAVDISRPIQGGLGILVNTLFAPVAFLGAAHYSDRRSIDRLLWRLTLVAGGIGALAIYQTNLTPDHWLNISMDGENAAYRMGNQFFRVTSSFQFCNVLGSFTVLGVAICYGTFRRSQTAREKQIAATCLILIYLGGVNSGSRVASIGTLLVLLCCVLMDRGGKKNAMYMVIAISLLVGTMAIVAPQRVARFVTLGQTRAFHTHNLGSRMKDLYLNETMRNAWQVGHGLGTGWGSYTIGVEKYAAARRDGPPLPYIEGGYSFVLAQTGIVGLFVFCYSHFALLLHSLKYRSEWAWLGVGLAAWPLLGNMSFALRSEDSDKVPMRRSVILLCFVIWPQFLSATGPEL